VACGWLRDRMPSTPRNAKRGDVRQILEVAAQNSGALRALWEAIHGRHPKVLTSDAEIGASLERAKDFASFPRIVEAEFHCEPKVEFLRLKLSDGQVLLVPREMLNELKGATAEQVRDVKIALQGLAVWWPQIDDGVYLPDFLERRWGKVWRGVAA